LAKQLDALTSGEEMSLTALFLTNALEHKDIIAQLREVSETSKRIESQVIATNSRVTKLEGWRGIAVGALVVLIPVLMFLANTVLSNTGIIRKVEQIHKSELSTSPPSEQLRK